MNRASQKLVEHGSGNGRLLADGEPEVPVQYVLDTWTENIPTGSGTWAEMQSRDGVIWWDGSNLPHKACTLETENGQALRVNLFELRSQRARFYCV
ncbi:MAG TPA: hypothetical protein VGF06_01255 [Terriglobales bacterium]|jgi:hypothetical protein